MPELPSTRTACMETLHELIADDAWLARYALLRACQQLDLHDLINLVHELPDSASEAGRSHRARVRALVRERWGL